MNFFLRIALLSTSCLLSVNLFAKVIVVVPAGGLTGQASLVLANRIDQKLHERGHQFADLVDHGVGVSVGAQVVALLLAKNEQGTKHTTSNAVDLFLESAAGTFPVFTNVARAFMRSYVKKPDIEKVIRMMFDGDVTSLTTESLTQLWDGNYCSYASFWTKVPELLLTVNPELNKALDADGKEAQREILRKKLYQEFGDARFDSDDFKKVTAIASYDGRPVAIGSRALTLPKTLWADKNSSVVHGLMASAAMPFIPDHYLDVEGEGSVRVTDGANAYSGMSPLETVVSWSLEHSNDDDVIISLGNGGPFDSDYREKLNFHDGVAVINKGDKTLKVFALEPKVEYWYMSTFVEERSLVQDLIAAANNVSDDLIGKVAQAMLAAHNVSEKTAIAFTAPRMMINYPAFETAIPPEELERICKSVVSTVQISPSLVQETIRVVDEAKRRADELLKQARLEEETRRIARELEESRRRAEEEARRIARELEANRQRAEEEARRLAAEAARQTQQITRSVGNAFRRWNF